MSPLVENEGAEFLALDGVALRLRETVVFENTSWTWRRGEQWALLGFNGSGKSLVIEALLGRVPLVREKSADHGVRSTPPS